MTAMPPPALLDPAPNAEQAALLAALQEPEVRVDGCDILVLSPTPTVPTDQGNRKRVHAVCAELQRRGARIHFVYYPQEWWFDFVPHDLARAMSAQWESFHLLPATRQLWARPAATDYVIDEWWDDAIGPYLQWLFKRNRYDAFIVNYAFMSKALEYAPPHTLKILDTHDQFTGRRELLDRNGITPDFFYTTADQEAIALNRAHMVWAIKDEEAEFYRSISGTPCITMPHVEPETRTARVRRPEDEGRLVIGMLGSQNAININNARAFVATALPLIEQRNAPVTIRFVGGMCGRLQDLKDVPGVDLRGPVESVDEFYRDVDVVIVPLAFSTGLKIKAVEAFATGMPVVAMAHALEGIPTTHRWHRCHSMEEVTHACCDIAFAPELIDELAHSTVQTYARVRALAKIAVDRTLRKMVMFPTVVMTVDRAFFDLDSLYREHVFQTVNFLQHLTQVVLYFDQPLPANQTALFEAFHGMAPHCKLAVAPGVESPKGRSLGLSSTIATLQQVLSNYGRVGLWALRVNPEMLELAPQPARIALTLRLDILRMFQPELAAGNQLRRLTEQFDDVTLTDSHTLAAPVDAAPHCRLIVVPFWRWKPWLIGSDGAQQRVDLLARPDQLSLARVLAQTIDRFHPHWQPTRIVLAGSPASDLPADRAVVQLSTLMSHFRAMRPTPKLAIDLSGDAAEFDLYRECLVRCSIPVVRRFSEVALGDQVQLLRPPQLWGLIQMLTRFETMIPDWSEEVRAEEKNRYGSDAGWMHLWKSISVKNVLGLN